MFKQAPSNFDADPAASVSRQGSLLVRQSFMQPRGHMFDPRHAKCSRTAVRFGIVPLGKVTLTLLKSVWIRSVLISRIWEIIIFF